jgi:hypothetical protein
MLIYYQNHVFIKFLVFKLEDLKKASGLCYSLTMWLIKAVKLVESNLATK